MFHKRLMKMFPDNKSAVAGMVAAQWGMLLANLVLMLTAAEVIGSIFSGQMGINSAVRLVVILAGVLLVRAACTWENSRLSFQAAERVKIRLRKAIYEKLMRLGSRYTAVITTAEAAQISTEGVEQLEIYFAKYVPQFFYSLIAPLTLFAVTAAMSMKVAVVLLICVPLIPASIIAVQKFAKKLLSKYWGSYTQLGDSFLESLQGLTTLKIFQADEAYAKKMDQEAEQFRKVTMRVLIMQLNSISVMDIVAYGGAALGIVLAVTELISGQVRFAQCFFIIMISAEFFLPMRLLGSFFHIAMNGNAAADKIFRLLDAPEPSEGTVTEVTGSRVELEKVSFGYPSGQPVLEDVSVDLGDHGLTALVGESGCGKSTVTALITGKYIPDKGAVRIGGTKISELRTDVRMQKVTRIGHDSYIFQGTLRDNLRMGNPAATEEAMLGALEKVELREMAEQNGGLDMVIAEKAANLSGGQKQRLALARALLHDSDIYIFDEAASNVDVESENKIMEVVSSLAVSKLVLLISHRLANVAGADRIYVLRDRRIAEQGTHERLMEAKGYYHRLFEEQRRLEYFKREEAGI